MTKLPDFIIVNEEIKELLQNNSLFSLRYFRDLYEYIELYSFPRIEVNINWNFKVNIEPEIKTKLENHFKNNPNIIVTKKELASVVRRFITRFLIGNLKAEE